MSKKRICVVFCGGTIAMAKNPRTGALEPAKSPEELLSHVPRIQEHVTLERIVEVFNKDSTNLRPADWARIVEGIYQVYNSCDAIVVTHGTDTMTYSASAVAFAMQNLDKPIVFTGSQAPLDVLGSDAPFNLENAVRVACSDVKEVVISFGHQIHRAVRAVKSSEGKYNAFDSPITGPIGEIQAEIKWHDSMNRPNLNESKKVLLYQLGFISDILTVRSDPALEPWMLSALVKSKRLRGIVIEALGAGNLPDRYHEIIRGAVRYYSRPVVVASPFIGGTAAGMGTYAAGLGALQAGAIPAGDMTLPAATVKLSWLLSQIEGSLPEYPKSLRGMPRDDIEYNAQLMDFIRNGFNTDYVGEVSLQRKSK